MGKNQYKKSKKGAVYGVDEAGRGAWAGPVVAACVMWTWKSLITWSLKDSKKMSARGREKTYEEIRLLAESGKLAYGIGIIENGIIDAVGIREANRRAMEEALGKIKKETLPAGRQELKKKNEGSVLLIDGRDNYTFDIPDLPVPEYIVRGDSIVPQIMAASIVAKVTRDRLMIQHGKNFQGYGFEAHKWYGTKFHQNALNRFGILPIHRKSYAPIKLATFLKAV